MIRAERSMQSRRLGLSSLCLGLVLVGSVFDEAPIIRNLGIQPALIGVFGLLAIVVAREIRHPTIPKASIKMLLLFVFFGFALPITVWHDYAVEKAILLFTVTMFAAVGSPLVVTDAQHLRGLLNALTYFGMLLAVQSFWGVGQGIGESGRLSAYNVNPIWFGRAVGMAGLWLVVLVVHGEVRTGFAFVAIQGAIVALIGSGSKGPILAFVLSVCTAVVMYRPRTIRTCIVLMGFLLLMTGGILASIALASPGARERVLSAAQIIVTREDENRAGLYRIAIRIIREAPLGVGIGGFALRAPIQWPHNLLLEAFVEGGWLAGFYLVLLLSLAFIRGGRMARSDGALYNGLFAIMVFLFLNSLVSGDLISSRPLLCFVALTLSFWDRQRAVHDEPVNSDTDVRGL